MGTRGKETTIANVIDGLERTYELWQTFFEDVDYFHREVSRHYGPQVATSSPAARDALNDKKVRLGKVRSRYSYLQHLQARLNFLTYIMANSTLRLNPPQLELIWAVYVEQPLTNRASDIAFEWLTKLFSQSDIEPTASEALYKPSPPPTTSTESPATTAASMLLGLAQGSFLSNIFESASTSTVEAGLLGDQLLTLLFQRKLQGGPIRQMRPGAAQLFLQLFLYINGRSRAIRRDSESAKDGWVRHSQELEGLQTLWGMALEAVDTEVRKGKQERGDSSDLPFTRSMLHLKCVLRWPRRLCKSSLSSTIDSLLSSSPRRRSCEVLS